MTLTLFDSKKNAWSERIVFIINQEWIVINANLNLKNLRIEGKLP